MKRLRNFMKKFIETARFRNDHFGAIMGYVDYVIGDSVISRVYYVEGLGHNLFSVRQFCDSDLKVAFRKHSCYVCDTDGVELIKGSCGSNLYTISVEDMMKSSPIFLLSKASKNKSWLWHQCLNHLNFGTINDLARNDLVRGLPRLKFEKDHICSACQLGKSKKHTHTPKAKNTNLEVLNTLHMDLCGPMRVQTINGKKYILVIIDDYLSIFHQKSVPRTLQQNGIVERRNHTLVEAARTMMIFSKALIFLWAEVVATVCYTQNRSLIHTRHNKTLYELVHDKKPDLTFFRVFGALCYPTNDRKDPGKLQPTSDIRIFIGYALSRKGYRIYNKRTRRIMETIHVQFDEPSEPMAPVQLSTGPTPTFLTPGQISSGLVPNSVPTTPYVPPTNKELEILFQPMFNEYLEPPRVERPVSPAPAVPVPVNSAGIPLSTTIDQVMIDINRPLPLSGPPGHVTVQTQFFFNHDLDYLRYGSKGNRQALSISKMKAAHYHDFRLELLVPEHMWIDDVCTYDISASYGISHWWFNRQEFYIDRHTAESSRKPGDFEDMNLLLLQGHLNHLPGSDIRTLSTVVKPWIRNLVIRQQKIMRFNEIYKFSDGTLTNIMEALDYRVKEYKVNRLNPGMNTRFWTDKDVERSKEFIHAIEQRLKTRRIFWNLECFVGGRVRNIDYRLLQRTK
ncbi:retrovirus-related pol polyprotein from transposon TNT 1-94 [Tanacetum coccineum]